MLENHYMNFAVTREMPAPEAVPEKFMACGLRKKARAPRDVVRRSQAGHTQACRWRESRLDGTRPLRGISQPRKVEVGKM